MSDYHQPLMPGETYHLFSRAVGNEKLFLNEGNYLYFLSKLKQYISPVAELYTYSLLPNHFHLLARIKQRDIIVKLYEQTKKKPFQLLETDLPNFIMESFSNFLNSYAKAFNKMHSRRGALFMDYLKRSLVKSEADFISFVFYVHKNAVHHGITQKIGLWPYDAFNSLLSKSPTLLLRDELIETFGGLNEFIKFHQQPIELKLPENI